MTIEQRPLPRNLDLSAVALERLKQLLITGQLLPGEKLPLRGVAEALGVSMMPVRQAVYQLVAERALEISTDRTVRVPVLSSVAFVELTRIRMHVEGFAAANAVLHINDSLVAQLIAINDDLRSKMNEPIQNADALISLNQRLHFIIYETAAMPLLYHMIEALWLRVGPILNWDLRRNARRTWERDAPTSHDHLIAALVGRDAGRAQRALAADIRIAFRLIYREIYGGDVPRLGVTPLPLVRVARRDNGKLEARSSGV